MGHIDIPLVVREKATDFTVDNSYFGSVNIITGATAVTLPAVSTVPIGAWVEFYLIVDEELSLTGTANEVVCYNAATAESLTFGQTGEQIGSSVRAICDGTSWLLQTHLADEANSTTVGDA